MRLPEDLSDEDVGCALVVVRNITQTSPLAGFCRTSWSAWTDGK